MVLLRCLLAGGVCSTAAASICFYVLPGVVPQFFLLIGCLLVAIGFCVIAVVYGGVVIGRKLEMAALMTMTLALVFYVIGWAVNFAVWAANHLEIKQV